MRAEIAGAGKLGFVGLSACSPVPRSTRTRSGQLDWCPCRLAPHAEGAGGDRLRCRSTAKSAAILNPGRSTTGAGRATQAKANDGPSFSSHRLLKGFGFRQGQPSSPGRRQIAEHDAANQDGRHIRKLMPAISSCDENLPTASASRLVLVTRRFSYARRCSARNQKS